MELEKSTDRSWHIMSDDTNREYLGSIRLSEDEYWRFRPTSHYDYTVRELREISRLVSDLNNQG